MKERERGEREGEREVKEGEREKRERENELCFTSGPKKSWDCGIKYLTFKNKESTISLLTSRAADLTRLLECQKNSCRMSYIAVSEWMIF